MPEGPAEAGDRVAKKEEPVPAWLLDNGDKAHFQGVIDYVYEKAVTALASELPQAQASRQLEGWFGKPVDRVMLELALISSKGVGEGQRSSWVVTLRCC